MSYLEPKSRIYFRIINFSFFNFIFKIRFSLRPHIHRLYIANGDRLRQTKKVIFIKSKLLNIMSKIKALSDVL